jgi:hypothetical protein
MNDLAANVTAKIETRRAAMEKNSADSAHSTSAASSNAAQIFSVWEFE